MTILLTLAALESGILIRNVTLEKGYRSLFHVEQHVECTVGGDAGNGVS